MVSLWTVGVEASALGAALLSLPWRLVRPREEFRPEAPHPTPVLLVHGFLGDASNFLVLRKYLESRGVPNLFSFTYPPRLDYPREAARLGLAVAGLRAHTGYAAVDIVGHSLGGLVARHYLATEGRGLVRRLVTLGAPHVAEPPAPEELAIFAAHDPFVEPPPADGDSVPGADGQGWAAYGGRVIVIPDCGHWGLLCHPAVLREVASYLRYPEALEERGAATFDDGAGSQAAAADTVPDFGTSAG